MDSTPVECARSRETVQRSDLAGWALSGAKADERDVFEQILATTAVLAVAREHGQITIGDKNYYGREFEARIDTAGIELLRPARKGEKPGVGNASINRCAR